MCVTPKDINTMNTNDDTEKDKKEERELPGVTVAQFTMGIPDFLLKKVCICDHQRGSFDPCPVHDRDTFKSP